MVEEKQSKYFYTCCDCLHINVKQIQKLVKINVYEDSFIQFDYIIVEGLGVVIWT